MKDKEVNDEGLAAEILTGTAVFPITNAKRESENPELEVMRSREKEKK
ncbi:hypothetical protein [Metabacillus iocasae]|uniref:Uncharacterized protein n=1 Tax=Priestia iocasae TaxID=2291674 RepID=A0ABS2QWI2_9BACI|nr:hypothetical protein [Metabacillus iocasae]MBM7703787.1 hypothetical protein [Metabacillus iocasae]